MQYVKQIMMMMIITNFYKGHPPVSILTELCLLVLQRDSKKLSK